MAGMVRIELTDDRVKVYCLNHLATFQEILIGRKILLSSSHFLTISLEVKRYHIRRKFVSRRRSSQFRYASTNPRWRKGKNFFSSSCKLHKEKGMYAWKYSSKRNTCLLPRFFHIHFRL